MIHLSNCAPKYMVINNQLIINTLVKLCIDCDYIRTMGRKRIGDHLVNRVLKDELKDAPITSVKGILIVTYINNTFDSYKPRSKSQIVDALKTPSTHFILKVTAHVTQLAPVGKSLVPFLLNKQLDSKCHVAAQELDSWLNDTHGVSLRSLTTIGALAASKRIHNGRMPTKELYPYNSEMMLDNGTTQINGHNFKRQKASEVGVDLNDEASKFLKQHGVL